MSKDEGDQPVPADECEEEELGYVPPAQRSLDSMLNQDAEDASLQKYKQALLGGAATKGVIIDENCPHNVIIRRMVFCVDGGEEIEINIDEKAQEKEKAKKEPIKVKEGSRFCVLVEFHVQREIVAGLRLRQSFGRAMLPVQKKVVMIGSYPPSETMHEFRTPYEETPKGLVCRGTYNVLTEFRDDDGHEFAKFKWSVNITH